MNDSDNPVSNFLLVCLGIAWVILAVGIVIMMLRKRKAERIALESSWSWTIPDSPHANHVPMAPGRWTICPAEGTINWRRLVDIEPATDTELEQARRERNDDDEKY